MSLGINTDRVVRVLLADGWHDVVNRSFDIDAYEFLWQGKLIHGGGQSGITSAGFTFEALNGVRIAGPLTAVLAIEEHLPKKGRA